MQTLITWIDPKEKMPPFDKRILVLVGGTGSLNFFKDCERYATIFDAIITKHSPQDDSDETDEYNDLFEQDEPLAAFSQYQFDVHVWYQWKFEDAGGDSGDEAEWYSDAILRWAKMPDFSEAIPSQK